MSSYYEKFLATGEVKCIDEEVPFEIPETWEWCRIKLLFSMQAGKNISSFELSDIPTSSHTYPCYGGNGLRGYVNRYNTEGNFILVGRQGALCGNVKEAKGKFYATEHAVITDGYGLTHLHWAYFFLWALDLNQYATATAQPGLAVSNIMEVLIPLPPHKEQIRIASKIDDTMQYVESFAKAQNELEALNYEVIINLRKSILQKAIQGRLVPQDASEEPATILLQRIKEEKLRLVKEGKLKKKDVIDSTIFRSDDNKYYEQVGKQSIDITEDIPFEINPSWQWIRLSCVADIYTGNSISESEKQTRFTDVVGRYYIGTKDVGFDNIVSYNNGVAIPKQYEHGFRIAPNHSILMCIEGGSAGRKIAILNQDVCFGNKLCCFSPFINIGKFIYYYLQSQSFIDMFNAHKTGIIGGVSIAKVKEILIPLPPIQEQQRIVAQIEKLFEQLK